MPNQQVAKKLKNTYRLVSETAVAATEAKEAAFKKKPKSFMLKDPVVVFSSASGSGGLDMIGGAWQLLSAHDSAPSIATATSDSEDETTTPVCAHTSKTAAVAAEDPATRDSHMDAAVAHMSPLHRIHMVTQSQSQSSQDKIANEPVATTTFAECVNQSLDLQRSCISPKDSSPPEVQRIRCIISEKEVEPPDLELPDWEDVSEKEEAPEDTEVAKTDIEKEEKGEEPSNAGCGPLILRSRGRSRKRERSREISVSGERSRVKSRRKNWSTCTQIVHAGLDASLVRRPASNASPNDWVRLRPAGPLPACVGTMNFMMASWVIGKQVKLREFCQKLKDAPFDVVLLTLTKAICSDSVIWRYLQALVVGGTGERRAPNPSVSAVLDGKVVLCLKDSVWMVVNRAKVSDCHFAEGCYRSRGKACPLFFGELHLTMKTTRQRMPRISIGVICIQAKVYQHERRMLAHWIVENRIAVLGGCWGWGQDTARFVRDLAVEAGAVGNGPCAQQMLKLNNRSREWETVTHPSYFLLFGCYRQITWYDPAGPGDFVMGRDVEAELIPLKNAPSWNLNQVGSAHVPELGNIKMKDPDFERWCTGSFQTCVWMGTSTPSYKSQLLSLNR